jgi:hypothetical protein
MSLFRTLLAAALAAGLLTSPALADRKREQDRAYEGTRKGRMLPLPELRERVLPLVGEGAKPLSPEISGKTYRMKFMRGGKVIWVDIDSETGRVIRRSE